MNHSLIVTPRPPSVSIVTLEKNQVARAIVLNRIAYESAVLEEVEHNGVRVPHHVVRYGNSEHCVFESELKAGGRLITRWRSKLPRPRLVNFLVETVTKSNLSSLGESIALQIGCELDRFELILKHLAERFNVSSEQILEFFGEDGLSTVEAEYIESLKKRAEETAKPAGELITITLLGGAARAVSERAEFDKLRKEGSDETEPDDFKVEARTVSETPQAIETETTSFSEVETKPTMRELITLANTLETDVEWTKSAIRIISELRKVKADDILTKALDGLRLLSTFNGQGLDNFQRGSAFLDKIAQTCG
jgi:hypothetical protein